MKLGANPNFENFMRNASTGYGRWSPKSKKAKFLWILLIICFIIAIILERFVYRFP